MRRYKDGADTYLRVVISQTVALQNERHEIDIRQRQMAASVSLIRHSEEVGILPDFQRIDTSDRSTVEWLSSLDGTH
jgi:hypothetical protein